MNRPFFSEIVCFLLSATGASVARAQASSPATSGPSSSQTMQQSQGQNSSAASMAASVPQKKVWTNEDIGELRSDSSISTFQPKGDAAKNAKSPAANSHGRDAPWYRQQIEKLQQQIPPIDAKIAELQKGVDGGTVNDPNTSSRPYGGVHAGSWQRQIGDLQARRADILEKIGGLEDQARRAGVSPGELP